MPGHVAAFAPLQKLVDVVHPDLHRRCSRRLSLQSTALAGWGARITVVRRHVIHRKGDVSLMVLDEHGKWYTTSSLVIMGKIKSFALHTCLQYLLSVGLRRGDRKQAREDCTWQSLPVVFLSS